MGIITCWGKPLVGESHVLGRIASFVKSHIGLNRWLGKPYAGLNCQLARTLCWVELMVGQIHMSRIPGWVMCHSGVNFIYLFIYLGRSLIWQKNRESMVLFFGHDIIHKML